MKHKGRVQLPKGFWTRFAQDSADREIFKARCNTATIPQLRALLSDANYYADKHGPDMIWPGLKRSARVTADKVRDLLRELGEDA
jgi:hypothetical protein